MAKGIEAAAQRHLEEQRQKAEEEAQLAESRSSRNYTPVSSFLTARTVDPDGHPRRGGHATPRSLAEIVGDENIFAYLHQYFVAILRCLGDRFGGLPLAGKPSIYQSVSDELPRFAKTSAVQNRGQSTSLGQLESLRDEDTTPTPHMPIMGQTQTWPKSPSAPIAESRERDDLEVAKTRANQAFKMKPQCAPLTVSETAQRQVVV